MFVQIIRWILFIFHYKLYVFFRYRNAYDRIEKLRSSFDFWLSESHVDSSSHMQSLIQDHHGVIPIEKFADFPSIKREHISTNFLIYVVLVSPHIEIKGKNVVCKVRLNDASKQRIIVSKGYPTNDPNVTVESVKQIFEKYGKVETVEMMKEDNQFNGTCVIRMSHFHDENSPIKTTILFGKESQGKKEVKPNIHNQYIVHNEIIKPTTSIKKPSPDKVDKIVFTFGDNSSNNNLHPGEKNEQPQLLSFNVPQQPHPISKSSDAVLEKAPSKASSPNKPLLFELNFPQQEQPQSISPQKTDISQPMDTDNPSVNASRSSDSIIFTKHNSKNGNFNDSPQLPSNPLEKPQDPVHKSLSNSFSDLIAFVNSDDLDVLEVIKSAHTDFSEVKEKSSTISTSPSPPPSPSNSLDFVTIDGVQHQLSQILHKMTELCTKDIQLFRAKLPKHDNTLLKVTRTVEEAGPPHGKIFRICVRDSITIEGKQLDLEFTTPWAKKKRFAERFADIYIYYQAAYHVFPDYPLFEDIKQRYMIREGDQESDIALEPLFEKSQLSSEQMEYKVKALRQYEYELLLKLYSWSPKAIEIIEEEWGRGSTYAATMQSIGSFIVNEDIKQYVTWLKEMGIYSAYSEFESYVFNTLGRHDVFEKYETDEDDVDENSSTSDVSTVVDLMQSTKGVLEISKMSAGYFESDHSYIEVWKTKCETSLGYDLLLPSISILFKRHFVEYQVRNLLKSINRPISFIFDKENSTVRVFIQVDCLPVILRKEQYFQRATRSLDFTSDKAWNLVNVISFDIDQELFMKQKVLVMSVFGILSKYGLLKLYPENVHVIGSFDQSSYKVPENIRQLDFFTRFKIQCLVSKHFIIKKHVTEEWIELLRSYEKVAYLVLQKIENNKKVVYDLMTETKKIYDQVQHNRHNILTLPKGYVYIPHCVVTPLRDICDGPVAELSNRVIRHFLPFKDHFIRVSFKEENTKTSIKSIGGKAARNKILYTLENGLYLEFLDMKFEFLAYSAGQLRGHKAWFFCPYTDANGTLIDANFIRAWMGELRGIYNVARFAARLGQAFSSTYETFDVDPSWIVRIDDIAHDDYVFSDGCGTCSMAIAKKAAAGLKLSYIPSVFQIRLGGIKGVVSVDPRLEGYKICIRPSMYKFDSPHFNFEVVTWSRPLPAHLNKQIIGILSDRGIPDDVFLTVQKEAIDRLFVPFSKSHDKLKIIQVLENTWRTKNVSDSLPSRALQMLRSGFDLDEPFLNAVLKAINSKRFKDLKDLARIPITDGQYAIGIIDEFNVLAPNQVFYQTSSSGTNAPITGKVLISRSPSLHPGDVRLAEAVNIPELSHLVDCLVFPATGKRPMFNECAGGDLDGDQYLIIWDQSLIPEKDIDPSPHSPSSVASRSNDDNEVTLQEIKEFFTQYIMEDRLGQIADAHMYFADTSPDGTFNHKCIQLASYHNIAVDAPKTGKEIPSIKEYGVSEWPDFMCMSLSKSYMSQKILGKLYRTAGSDSHFALNQPITLESLQLDKDLLIEGSDMFYEEACAIKRKYALDLACIMDMYSLIDEATSLSGDAFWKNVRERREWQSKRDGYDAAIKNLRNHYRKEFYSNVDEKDEDMTFKKASAWYFVTYSKEFYVGDEDIKVSFPWVVDDILCKIKLRNNRQ